jgi:hypothetical protein
MDHEAETFAGFTEWLAMNPEVVSVELDDGGNDAEDRSEEEDEEQNEGQGNGEVVDGDVDDGC